MATHKFSYASDLGWAQGESLSKYAGAQSTHDPASKGIDIFRTPGCLRAGMAPTEIGGANVTDNITVMKIASDYNGTTISRVAYCYGSAGKLYQITDEATPTVTVIGTIGSNADGLEIHKDYVYYAQTTQIGRYGAINVAGGSRSSTDAYWTGFTATKKGQTLKHPLHSWRGKLFAGDANLLKYVIGSESSGTTGTTQMTLDSDYVITVINDNGPLLLIGAGQEAVEDTQTKVGAWLLTWDGNSATTPSDTLPTDKFLFPEPYIHRIDVVEGDIYCFGLNHVYKLVGSTFVIVSRLDCRVALGGTDVHKGQLWFKGSDDIRAIGSPDPQLPVARYRPYSGTGTSITAIKWMQDSKLWYADNNNLYEAKTGSQTAVTWKSRLISFGKQEMVDEVRIYLQANLASGDDVRVQVIDEVGNATTIATFDYATYGAVNELTLRAHQFTNAVAHRSAMQGAVLFQSGAAVVREVHIITKPVAQP